MVLSQRAVRCGRGHGEVGRAKWAARLRRHARGSTLILAVVLLVLMALVGVAFLTTTRNDDRHASYQHTASAQADLLLDDVVTLVEGALVDDLFDGATDAAAFRRPGMTYEHVDGEELFLAARVPAWDAGTYRWPMITAPILGGPFVSPDGTNHIVGRNNPAPTSITINGRKHPALDFGAGGGVIRAADTDGDGVADAGLWPLPVSSGDGLRWYAAVRIIDNNSALNLATASRRAGAVEAKHHHQSSRHTRISRVSCTARPPSAKRRLWRSTIGAGAACRSARPSSARADSRARIWSSVPKPKRYGCSSAVGSIAPD